MDIQQRIWCRLEKQQPWIITEWVLKSIAWVVMAARESIVHLEKDFSLYNTPVLDFIQVTQKKKAASIIALVCGSERYAKGLKETLQFISDQIMLFYTPESAKTRLGRHKPDLWIVTEDMTSQPNQPWRADRTTPVILITGNPDAVEIKKNSGKLTVLSMPLSIVDLRKTVEIYVS